jgi:hypothetical protein
LECGDGDEPGDAAVEPEADHGGRREQCPGRATGLGMRSAAHSNPKARTPRRAGRPCDPGLTVRSDMD